MAHRDRQFDVKAVALAVAVLVMLVVDAALLNLFVMPLAAETRAAANDAPERTAQSAELALILPTHDPRTPWPTRTPTRTATPWLISSPPRPAPATAPAESPALPDKTVAPATMPAEDDVPAQGAVAPVPPVQQRPEASPVTSEAIPTPVPQQVVWPAVEAPIGGALATAVPEPPVTPVVPAGETPAGEPTATPQANSGETPESPAPTPDYEDLLALETFLHEYRNTVAGVPVDIVSVTIDMTEGSRPRIVLEVAAGDSDNIFAAQPAASIIDYGHLLLDDAKRYLGNQPCAIAIESTYATSNGDVCSQAPDWCHLGSYDQAANSWPVTWTYMRGSFAEGRDTVEAWNEGQ